MGYTPIPCIPPPVLTEDERFYRELQARQKADPVIEFYGLALLLLLGIVLLVGAHGVVAS